MKTKNCRSVICLGAIILLHLPVSDAAGQQVINGSVRPEIASLGLQPIGTLDSAAILDLAVGLPLRNQAELVRMLKDIYDPTSLNYRHFLSVSQFTAEYGPKMQDCDSVVAFAQFNHLSVIHVYSNNILISLRGRAADIERALNTRFLVYNHPTENRTFYCPDRDPSINLNVPILQIAGLDNFGSLHSGSETSRSHPAHVTTAGTGSGPHGSFMGYDFRSAYAHNVTLDGSGQILGLLEFGSFDNTDITYYENKAGLPNVPLASVVVYGNPTKGLYDEEECGDIEMAISMAPRLSKLIVYEAEFSIYPTDYRTRFEYLLDSMATENQAKQLSSSFFISNTQTDATADQVFMEMALQGQSFFECSADCDAFNIGSGGNLVTFISKFPCGDPLVTVVGGTVLTTNGPPNENWVSDNSWNSDPVYGQGSGGGYNSTYVIPSWQQGLDTTTNLGSTHWRNIPDVSMNAWNVYIHYDGVDDSAAFGTSYATPLWAGFVALVNQNLAAHSMGYAGFINPTLYAIAKGSGYGTDFHDVTLGNNIWSYSENRFPACQGYDLCTGWGTPTGQSLINDFGPSLNITYGSTLTVPIGQTLTVQPGTNVVFTNGASLIVNGTLNAAGAASQPITLSFSAPNSSTHNGIQLNSTAGGSAISYCKVLHADRGIAETGVSVNISNSAIDSCTNGIYLVNSSPTIQNCNIHDNSYAGIYATSSSPNVSGDNYIQNNGYGVYCTTNSNPTFGSGSTQGMNNLTNNTYGVFCWNNSLPMLGQNSPMSGGYDNFVNTSWNVYNMSWNGIYANDNWWGTTNPNNFKIGGTGAILYSPYLSSSVNIPQPPLSKPSTIFSVADSGGIPMRSTLDRAYQLFAANDLIDARNACLNLINNYPDYTVSFNALNLLRQTFAANDIPGVTGALLPIFSRTPKNELYAAAGLLLANVDKANRGKWLDQVWQSYGDQSVGELALFDKFVWYYFDQQDMQSALGVSKLLDTLFAKSQGAAEVHRILGDPAYYTVNPNPGQLLSKSVSQTPTSYAVSAAYPNPFNPSTQISYSLPEAGRVSLVIYDVLGREISMLADGNQQAGRYTVTWNSTKSSGVPVSSGMYFARLRVTNDLGGLKFAKTIKLLLTK